MDLSTKVLIDNLCSWPLYFRRSNGFGDVRVPANAKNFAALDLAEVQAQIQLGNTLFVGDGNGDHARLFISDEQQRKALYGLDSIPGEDTTVLTQDAVKELLAIRGRDAFQKKLDTLVKTSAERKMLIQVAKEAGSDEVAAWKMELIRKAAEADML